MFEIVDIINSPKPSPELESYMNKAAAGEIPEIPLYGLANPEVVYYRTKMMNNGNRLKKPIVKGRLLLGWGNYESGMAKIYDVLQDPNEPNGFSVEARFSQVPKIVFPAVFGGRVSK